MIIDFHCHLGYDSDGGNFTYEQLKSSMAKNGITKSVVFPFSGSDEKLIQDSISILTLSKNSDKLIPFLRFNPRTITKDQLETLLNMGFKGVKLHPSAQKFVPEFKGFDWIYKMILEFDLPILFHCNGIDFEKSSARHFITLSHKFPNLKIIIAHFAGNDIDALEEIMKYSNIYVDTSINSRTMRINSFVKMGFNRFVFASDAPYDKQSVALLKIRESELTKDEEDIILYKNALKLLKL